MAWRWIIAATVCVTALSGRAEAQDLTPGPPGPYVLDIRGVSSGIPNGERLHPDLAVGSTVPTRGFGGSLSAHVYAFRIGPGRLGLGVDALYARGSSTSTASTFFTAAPQLSLNFGTADGWSYLSAGAGSARVRGASGGLSETVRSINWGGGARWFLSPHLGVGFDIRVHMLAAKGDFPKATTLAAGVGFSVK